MGNQMSSKHQSDLNPDLWVDRYGDALYRFALSKLTDTAAAQDLVQETFVAALHARKRFKGQASVKTWLISILRHKVVDYYRKKTRELTIESTGTIAEDTDQYFNHNGRWRIKPGKWTANPVKIYEQKEFLKLLYQCLAHLPERLAKAFVMRELEGLETDEICKALSITATNSWVMLYRARTAIRQCIEVNWLKAEA
jgi:RNA polymerase sigma-70 factor (ECF subfamily)